MSTGIGELSILVGCFTAFALWAALMATLGLKFYELLLHSKAQILKRRRILEVEMGQHVPLAERLYDSYEDDSSFGKPFRKLRKGEQQKWERVATLAVELVDSDRVD